MCTFKVFITFGYDKQNVMCLGPTQTVLHKTNSDKMWQS